MYSHWRNLVIICFLLIFLSSCNEMKTEEIFETAVCTEEPESKIETDTEAETETDTQETVNIGDNTYRRTVFENYVNSKYFTELSEDRAHIYYEDLTNDGLEDLILVRKSVQSEYHWEYNIYIYTLKDDGSLLQLDRRIARNYDSEAYYFVDYQGMRCILQYSCVIGNLPGTACTAYNFWINYYDNDGNWIMAYEEYDDTRAFDDFYDDELQEGLQAFEASMKKYLINSVEIFDCSDHFFESWGRLYSNK